MGKHVDRKQDVFDKLQKGQNNRKRFRKRLDRMVATTKKEIEASDHAWRIDKLFIVNDLGVATVIKECVRKASFYLSVSAPYYLGFCDELTDSFLQLDQSIIIRPSASDAVDENG